MMMIAVAGLASLLLLSIGVWLMVRAGGKPPLSIRTDSHRSQAEYAFNRHAGTLRQQGYACLMAAVLCLAICLTMSVWSALNAE